MPSQTIQFRSHSYTLESFTGTLQSIQKRTESYTESAWHYSDGSSGPIQTRNVLITEVYLLLEGSNKEFATKFTSFDIQAQPGHRLTLIGAKHPNGRYVWGHIYNHNLDNYWKNWNPIFAGTEPKTKWILFSGIMIAALAFLCLGWLALLTPLVAIAGVLVLVRSSRLKKRWRQETNAFHTRVDIDMLIPA